MKKQIQFSSIWTIEQRKAAINKCLEVHIPFEIKKMILTLPGNIETEYTGGLTQMLLASGITIELIRI